MCTDYLLNLTFSNLIRLTLRGFHSVKPTNFNVLRSDNSILTLRNGENYFKKRINGMRRDQVNNTRKFLPIIIFAIQNSSLRPL